MTCYRCLSAIDNCMPNPAMLECRIASSIQEVAPAAWDACAGPHPFVQHAFLKALETSGALGPTRGVLPKYVLLMDSMHGLVACAPAMLKWGNKREFGPEIRWLNAGAAAGCFAWPKFQVGVPFFPVMGPKLLVQAGLPQAVLQRTLLQALQGLEARADGMGVFNVMHIDAELAKRCQASGALISHESHSMWINPGYSSYADFIAELPNRKRYQWRKERQIVNANGLTFRVLKGREITDRVLLDYYEGHRRVCARHGGTPWLPADTYRAIVAAMPDVVILMGYFAGSHFVAGSLKLLQDRVLYALQWSELEQLSGVALDMICHRPIEYAIEHGFERMDSGLAAAHKQHRGWQTVSVYHAHWFYSEMLKALALRELAP